MHIRPGTLDDAAAMASIFNYYVKTSPVIFSCRTLSDREMREKLAGLGLPDAFPFLIAEEEGRVLGYAYAHLWMPDPVYGRSWEVTIYLDKDSCGKGTGSALLSSLIAKCREAGAHMLVSWISEGNVPCEKMHQHAGFRLAGRIIEAGDKFGRYWNDTVYQLLL